MRPAVLKLLIHRGTACVIAWVKRGPIGASVGLLGLTLISVSLSLLHALSAAMDAASAAICLTRMIVISSAGYGVTRTLNPIDVAFGSAANSIPCALPVEYANSGSMFGIFVQVQRLRPINDTFTERAWNREVKRSG